MSEDMKYASFLFDSPLGIFAGIAMMVAGGGIGVGAGYYGYNSGNVQTQVVRVEMDYHAAQVINNRARFVEGILKERGKELSPQELSDILKVLAEPPFRVVNYAQPVEKKQ
ncbi:hypothetical protein HY484_03550 [Candidatus Woesearchaeota archaeon]|nr:hypothetical protein [Candidatus Woesearchaeota archaeon]